MSIKIRINNKFQIISNSNQYTIQRHSIDKKTNEDVWDSFAYYSDLISCLDAVIDLNVKESTATNLKEVVEVVEETKTFIKDSLKGINYELAIF